MVAQVRAYSGLTILVLGMEEEQFPILLVREEGVKERELRTKGLAWGPCSLFRLP